MTGRIDNEPPSPDLEDIKQHISSAAKELTGEELQHQCQQLLTAVELYFDLHRDSPQLSLIELDYLIDWLGTLAENTFADQPENYELLTQGLLVPVVGLQEQLAEQLQPASDDLLPSIPILRIEPVITGQKLFYAGLVENKEEYEELKSLVPKSWLATQTLIPTLQAFRHLQNFNPGLNNQHFAQFLSQWPNNRVMAWAEQVNAASRSRTPFYHMMPGMADMLEAIALAQHIPEAIREVLPLLTIDGLASPCLIDQLHSLSTLHHALQGKSLRHQEMALAINQEFLSPEIIKQINCCKGNASELANWKIFWQERLGEYRDQLYQKASYYEDSGIAQQIYSQFGLAPYPVPPDNNSLYYAIGHLLGEPMNRVRQKCHQAAENIPAMLQGSYQGDHSPPYAGRLTRAARILDMARLKQLVKNRTLLQPLSFDHAMEALPLIAIAYGHSIVPLMADADYQDLFGFHVYGEKYTMEDESSPGAALFMTEQLDSGPLMLIYNGESWDPLVKA